MNKWCHHIITFAKRRETLILLIAVLVLSHLLPDTPLPSQDVLVTASRLQVGATLDREALAVQSVATNLVPKDALSPDMAEAILGMHVKRTLSEFEMVRITDFTEASLTPSHRIKSGHRLVVFTPSNLDVMADYLLPGDKVDLLWQPHSSSGGGVTYFLLQECELFQIENNVERGTAQVALSLSPEAAVTLTHAIGQGEIQLMLRNPLDQTHSVVRDGLTTAKLVTSLKPTHRKLRVESTEIIYGKSSEGVASAD